MSQGLLTFYGKITADVETSAIKITHLTISKINGISSFLSSSNDKL